jgi:hypothetical protein
MKNLIILIIISIPFIGCDPKSGTNKIEAKVNTELTPAQKDSINTEKRKIQIDNTISAKNLFRMYDENEVKADEYFKGKKFYVQGKVTSIANDILNNPYITLSSSNEFLSVQCSFENKKEVTELTKGQEVTILGECSGKLMNVMMNNCTLAENYKLPKK